MGGRLNKFLEFIGLVDDKQDGDRDMRDGNNGMGRPPYNSANYRSNQQAQFQQNYASYQNRRTSERQDYDMRQRRGGNGGYYPQQNQIQPYYDDGNKQDFYGRGNSGNRRDGYNGNGSGNGYRGNGMEDEAGYMMDPRRQAGMRNQSNYGAPYDPMNNGYAIPENEYQGNNGQTMIYMTLHSLEDCREVVNGLLDGKTVLLNMEGMDTGTQQRSVDTLCGAAFALHATLRKASGNTYLIAPVNVRVENVYREDQATYNND